MLPEHVEGDLLPAAHAELLPQGGLYAWRRDGERHAWDPQTIAALQGSVRNGNGTGGRPSYEEFSRRVNEENGALGMLRGLLRLKEAPDPLPIEAVEPAARIARRFVTGGDEPRGPLPGGARDARRRDEPDRGDVELRRGRRG